MTTDAKEQTTGMTRWYDKSQSSLPGEIIDMAQMAVSSGLWKDLVAGDPKSPAVAGMKLMIGQQLGVDFVTSLNYVHIIPGGESRPPKVQLGYQIIAELIARSGRFRFEIREHTRELCRIEFFKAVGGRWESSGLSVFSILDAKSAGLIKQGSAWEKWPMNMLFARALTNGARWYCPGALSSYQMAIDEPYIDGTAEIIEEMQPKEVTWGPEGPPDPWKSFWAGARESGYEREQVHSFFGVGPEDGALKEKVEANAAAEGMTVPEVLNAMLVALREGQSTVTINSVPFDPPESNNAVAD